MLRREKYNLLSNTSIIGNITKENTVVMAMISASNWIPEYYEKEVICFSFTGCNGILVLTVDTTNHTITGDGYKK